MSRGNRSASSALALMITAALGFTSEPAPQASHHGQPPGDVPQDGQPRMSATIFRW
jgi:hypothetical protein